MGKANKFGHLVGLPEREKVLVALGKVDRSAPTEAKAVRRKRRLSVAPVSVPSEDVKPLTPSTEKRRIRKRNRRGKLKSMKSKAACVTEPTDAEGEELGDRLLGSSFRYFNEQLYTQHGSTAEQLFSADHDAFRLYHKGFMSQLNKWPLDPLKNVVSFVRKQPRSLVVADMGCGDARLARSVPHTVHSFDFVALNDSVTPCNMADVPLDDGSVDVCVFCLSLMGTNLAEYLREANRILRSDGLLLIIEVVSRVASINGFALALSKLGFRTTVKRNLGAYFLLIHAKKVSTPLSRRPAGLRLKPCLYKKRGPTAK